MRREFRDLAGYSVLILLSVACAAKAQIPLNQLVSANGVQPTGSFIFPATPVGSSTTQTVQVNLLNILGTQYALSITVPQSAGGKQEFIVGTVSGCVADGTTFNPPGVCNVSITFTPAYAGERSEPLQLTVNYSDFAFGDASGTLSFGLSGVGLAPLAVVAPGTATLIQNFQPVFGGNIPEGLAVDGAGNVYASITSPGSVVKIDKDTAAVSTVIPSVDVPEGIAVDAAGDIFVVSGYDNKVYELYNGTPGFGNSFYPVVGVVGAYGFGGDGNAATATDVELAHPYGVAIDPSGNIFISDHDNERIRRVDASTQNITTYAGTGPQLAGAYGGDGGPATSAQLNAPSGLAADGAGNLYIADTANNRIRMVAASTGFITTVAGNGTAGYTGDGAQATAAELNGPLAVSLDAAGNLYIGDTGNGAVRKVDAATGVIYTVAGGGGIVLSTAGQTQSARAISLPGVAGVAVDPLGSLFATALLSMPPFASQSQVFKISPSSGAIAFPQQTLLNTPDTTDDPQKFYLSNDGTQPFSISVPASGTNPVLLEGFSIDNASACQPLLQGAMPHTVASGDTCVYGLDFTPTTIGSVTGTLTVTDTAPGSTQTMSLSGTGGTASATTTSLAFSSGADPSPIYTSTDTLTATVAHASVGATSPISGTVTFYADGTVLQGGSNVTLINGSASITFTQLLHAGIHTLTATFTPGNSSNLDPSTAASGLSVTIYAATQGVPNVAVDNHIYDGNPHGVTITTSPPNLPSLVYYEPLGSTSQTRTPPTLPGVYFVSCYIGANSDYAEIYSTAYLHIYPLPATVTVNSLSVPFGSPVPAPTVTTSPAGLATIVRYNGSTTPPTAIGQYLLSASVTTAGYAGYADGILEIYSPTLTTSAWIVNQDSTVSHLNSSGTVLSTSGTASGTSTLGSIAIDASGDAWAVANANSSVVEVSATGTLLGTYTGGGLLAPVSLAIDGLGNAWVANSGNSLTVLSTSGAAVSPGTGYLATSAAEATPLATPSGIAIDRTGSVWITNSGDSSVTRVFGAAAPVIAPTASAVAGSSLGVRP
jgi:sugar lactone lactonase YvrE